MKRTLRTSVRTQPASVRPATIRGPRVVRDVSPQEQVRGMFREFFQRHPRAFSQFSLTLAR